MNDGTRTPPEPRVVPFGDVLSLLDERRRLWERIERAEAQNDALRNVLGVIADSHPWEPYERGETIPKTQTPTNRRLAREAIRAD